MNIRIVFYSLFRSPVQKTVMCPSFFFKTLKIEIFLNWSPDQKVLIVGNGNKTWIEYKCMTFCYSVALICKIWKENQWPFWSSWSGLSIAAKQRLIALFVWILYKKKWKCWFSENVKKLCGGTMLQNGLILFSKACPYRSKLFLNSKKVIPNTGLTKIVIIWSNLKETHSFIQLGLLFFPR